jgi:hypothetical protein
VGDFTKRRFAGVGYRTPISRANHHCSAAREADRGEYRQAAGAIEPPPNVGSAMTNPKAPAVKREAEEDWSR